MLLMANPPHFRHAKRSRRKLKRSMGLMGLTFVAVGGIVGSGWLFAPLLATRLAGPAAIVAWGIGGVAMLLLALCFAEVMGILPVAGGIARIPHFTHGDVTSALLGWSAWVGYNTAAPIETIAMLQYLAVDWHWLFEGSAADGNLTWRGSFVAMGVLGVFVWINAMGVAAFSKANTAITWVKLGIPVVVGLAIMAARFEPSNFHAAGGFAPFGAEGIFAAVSSGGVIFALIGFRHAIDMAGEVKRPNVTIPLALTISLVICVGIYGLLQVAFVGALEPSVLKEGWGKIDFGHDLGPVAGVAAALGIAWMSILLKAGGVISPFGGGLVATGSMARLGYAMAESRVFPRYFAHLSKKRVPMRCLWLDYAFGGLVVFFVPFAEAVALNGAAITLSFAAGPLAVCALRQQHPEAERRFRMPLVNVFAPMAFVVATLIIIWSGWDTMWRLLLTMVVGVVVFLVRMRQERVRFDRLDLREASWLLPFIGGIGVISYLGDYGGGRGILDEPWLFVVAAVFALLVFWFGHRVRLRNEASAKYRERYMTEPPPDITPL